MKIPQPLDLRGFAAALPEQDLSPRSLQATVCGSITTAVAAFARTSPTLHYYTIDPALLKRVVGEYLETHPTHNNPFKLMVTELGDRCRVEYYDLCYGTNRNQQGKFEFIPYLDRRELVDGKYTSPSGAFYQGKLQCVEQMKGMFLKEGKAIDPTGVTDHGRFEYVEPMRSVRLVYGERTFPIGDAYYGTFGYVPGIPSDTQLISGTLICRGGRSEIGEFAYIPRLNGMRLVDGTIISEDGDVKTGTWAYSRSEGRMVFTPGQRRQDLLAGLENKFKPGGSR